jgi:putative transposase
MSLEKKPKRYRYPASIISYAMWQYHGFNLSFRDVQEQLAYRGIIVSHETVPKMVVEVFQTV